MSPEALTRILAIDLETTRARAAPVPREIAAVLGERSVHKRVSAGAAIPGVDELARAASWVLGHNVLEHDLAVVRRYWPASPLLQLPVVDTLLLSPISHPEWPYHALLKDYKLVDGGKNDPLADARLSLRAFEEQCGALSSRYAPATRLLSVFRTWFARPDTEAMLGDRSGMAHVFASLGGELLSVQEVGIAASSALEAFSCRTALAQILSELHAPVATPGTALSLAYALAWLLVSGSRSVLPAFVRRRFPEVPAMVRRLRDVNCKQTGCAWCREQHDARVQLQRWFEDFKDFRDRPADAAGRGLQRQIVEHGMASGSHLAILPTGGGKSICFQLPALVRNYRCGALTIVLSPLQALMKDQVDGFVRRTHAVNAATINGLLTPPERAQVLQGIRMGDVALVYVSPEQLRNISFRKAIVTREIGAWVFDEAHCLSKWGHDFRPDYLYAGRFIDELAKEQGVAPPPIVCVTATARREVRDEIVAYFEGMFGRRLTQFDGGVERENLHYRSEEVAPQEKGQRIHEIVSECLDAHQRGNVIVYHNTRKHADEMAEALRDRDIEAQAYHAGLTPPERKRVQDDFLSDTVRVICATNAFGMGVDKENVRLVVHAEIPGSLENYLQEAGRAGRDGKPAEAILLYDPADLETQFSLAQRSRLTLRDIQQLLRGLRKARKGADEFVISASELLRDPDVDTSFEAEDRGASTKVVTAVSWLERAEFLQRNENLTRVFQGTPAMPLAEAKAKIAQLDLKEFEARVWMHLLTVLATAEPDEALSIDDLAGHEAVQQLARIEASAAAAPSPPVALAVAEAAPPYGERELARIDARLVSKVVLRAFLDMARVGLIHEGMRMTAFVRYKVKDGSSLRLAGLVALEESLLEVMREAAPDAEPGGAEQELQLRLLNQALLNSHPGIVPDRVRKLLVTLSIDGRGMNRRVGSITLSQRSQDRFSVRLQRSWDELCATSRLRRDVAAACLGVLLERVPEGTPASAELLVEFAFADLAKSIERDLALRTQVRDPIAALERSLLFLHEHDVIVLQSGLALFHQSMTIRFSEKRRGSGYTTSDYRPLAEHYDERVRQIHVMDRYAQVSAAPSDIHLDEREFVRSYFDDESRTFLERWFPGGSEELSRATSALSYEAIVTALDGDQQAIVTAPADQNQLVLAGPGSGKTRIVVHRCAWLLRVERVRPESILMLCFNRSTARELHSRLGQLAGDSAKGVTIQTYDSLALRLVGRSLSGLLQEAAPPISSAPGDKQGLDAVLKKVRQEATEMLRGTRSVDGIEPDDVRDTLLAGYEQILVDEYQDIDEGQYNLISALAGRHEGASDRKLSILAVGDDDQNIYGWRGSDVRFLRQFERDYAAVKRTLTNNYRSTPHIVAAAAQVIAGNAGRMKAGVSLRPAPGRVRAGSGGAWSQRDPNSAGRVQRVTVPDALTQAQAVVEEIARVRAACPERQWSDFAIVARTWSELDSVRGLLEVRSMPCRLDRSRRLPSLFRVREVDRLLAELRQWREQRRAVDRGDLAALVDRLRAGTDNPWWAYAKKLVDRFLEERQAEVFRADDVLEDLCEAIHGDKDRAWFGDGVLLSTAHSVKGREYPFVFVLDGGWTAKAEDNYEVESERRLYYVGMTRAIEGLWVGRRADANNQFVTALAGDCVVDRAIDRRAGLAQPARRYGILALDDMWIDFAGRKAGRVHDELAALQAGAKVSLRAVGSFVHLSSNGVDVAALSANGRRSWQPRLDAIDHATVVCMVRWHRKDSEDSAHPDRLKVDAWSIPLVEIAWREGARGG